MDALRLRARDLPALQFFKETLEDRLRVKAEAGVLTFSLIKHTLLLLLGLGRSSSFLLLLLCLLLSMRFGDLDVWRVTSGVKAGPQERLAAGPLLVLKTQFGKLANRA